MNAEDPSSLTQREDFQAKASQGPQRPTNGLANMQSTTESLAPVQSITGGKKRRNHRAGKKKKGRRQSFLPGTEEEGIGSSGLDRPAEQPTSAVSRPPFYQLAHTGRQNLSEASLESEALLDHRDHHSMRPRRDSRVTPNSFSRPNQYRSQRQNSHDNHSYRHEPTRGYRSDEEAPNTERSPLLGALQTESGSPTQRSGYGLFGRQNGSGRRDSKNYQRSPDSSRSSRRRVVGSRQSNGSYAVHGVNNPPSVPNSPKLGPDMGYGDVMVTNSFTSRPPEARIGQRYDQIISIDKDDQDLPRSEPATPPQLSADQRRHTISLPAEEDVCFPVEGMSAIGEEDYLQQEQEANTPHEPRRRRYRRWPDLSVLDEWSHEEKEERSEGIRAKKISEPVLVGGRLRPQQRAWQRTEEDAPYRFTYFNEDFPSTIHSQTISELLQPGQDFRELFIPDPPELSDAEFSSDEDEDISHRSMSNHHPLSPNGNSRQTTRHSSLIGEIKTQSAEHSGEATPSQTPNVTENKQKPKRYGGRPTFWLDVLSPTDTEMRVISKTFGIHPLTAEDIMMQEAREKVELFPKYYFVNYRTFEQDVNSEDYLQPVNMYVVVFPEGVISFHFSLSPHPANVRRRIRQLKEYLQVTSDWISYAIIDDITDVFAPLIQSIEDDVDDIDDEILKLLYNKKDEGSDEKSKNQNRLDGQSEGGDAASGRGDMLRRVGEARKKVMILYRLLGNKADVIKGFAKRCNEKWRIAPKSDIGLYLGDIQDHILTMTGNLAHYETLLSRAHSNFLAQMNMRMNERQEQTADVLGKLTVLGTIVLPMNIVTGMWGMNVLVPGQYVDNLNWFWSITAGLFIFGFSCFFIAKRVYGIV